MMGLSHVPYEAVFILVMEILSFSLPAPNSHTYREYLVSNEPSEQCDLIEPTHIQANAYDMRGKGPIIAVAPVTVADLPTTVYLDSWHLSYQPQILNRHLAFVASNVSLMMRIPPDFNSCSCSELDGC